jgi:hypothetical protein
MKLPIKQFINLLVTILLFLFLFSSCQKKEQYPIIPVIEFKDYKVIQKSDTLDSTIAITFSFKDGDGDIGYPDGDSTHTSILVYYYKKKKGAFFLHIDPTNPDTNFNANLPMILAPGVKRPIKGDIEYSIDIWSDPIISKYDTVYVAFTLLDRALNVSNMIKTPEIVLKRKKK